jgi:hypothetical protein
MTQRVLQLIYDFFYGSGGIWPTLADLQQALNRQGGSKVDAARVIRHVPATLLRPLNNSDSYPSATNKLILTAEGVNRCAGSDKDIANFLKAVAWLASRVAQSTSADNQDEHAMPFTTRQLAEAVPLSLNSDPNSIRRLVAILQAEGWVHNDDATRRRSWARPLRGLANPTAMWRRAIFGLSEGNGAHAAIAARRYQNSRKPEYRAALRTVRPRTDHHNRSRWGCRRLGNGGDADRHTSLTRIGGASAQALQKQPHRIRDILVDAVTNAIQTLVINRGLSEGLRGGLERQDGKSLAVPAPRHGAGVGNGMATVVILGRAVTCG